MKIMTDANLSPELVASVCGTVGSVERLLGIGYGMYEAIGGDESYPAWGCRALVMSTIAMHHTHKVLVASGLDYPVVCALGRIAHDDAFGATPAEMAATLDLLCRVLGATVRPALVSTAPRSAMALAFALHSLAIVRNVAGFWDRSGFDDVLDEVSNVDLHEIAALVIATGADLDISVFQIYGPRLVMTALRSIDDDHADLVSVGLIALLGWFRARGRLSEAECWAQQQARPSSSLT